MHQTVTLTSADKALSVYRKCKSKREDGSVREKKSVWRCDSHAKIGQNVHEGPMKQNEVKLRVKIVHFKLEV